MDVVKDAEESSAASSSELTAVVDYVENAGQEPADKTSSPRKARNLLQENVEQLIQRLQQPEENRHVDATRYTPGPLPARAHDVSDVMDLLSGLITSRDDNGPSSRSIFPNGQVTMDSVTTAAIVAHSLTTFLSTLPRPHLQKLVTRIISDTTLWVSRLFRFFDTSASYHDDHHEGLVRLCRALLRLRYPKYEDDGYESLYTKPPVIYLSSVTGRGLAKTLCSMLGLPKSCICVISGSHVAGQQIRMDPTALDKAIQEDAAAQRIPLLVVANAGTSVFGQMDNLQALQDICKTRDVWLHVEGHSLAGLCLVPAPTLPARVGDSLTLPLGEWLGVPGIPIITLYKTFNPSTALSSGLQSSVVQQKLNCLPLWVTLQVLGHEGVVSRIQHAFQLARHLQDRVAQVPFVKLFGKQTDEDKLDKVTSVMDLTKTAVSTSVLFDVLTPTVTFQYVGKGDVVTSSLSSAYFNSLNSWLGQILQRDVSGVHLDIVELQNNTVCLRFCPLEALQHNKVDVKKAVFYAQDFWTSTSANYLNAETTMSTLDSFVGCLIRQVNILNATVTHKEHFPEVVARHPNLVLVELAEWAGLGGVQYVPDVWKDNIKDLPDIGKEDLNRINEELVTQLKATDSAFSLGEGEDGVYCVRFGMVTEDTDMEELLAMVTRGGRNIEENSKRMDEMAEMIKKGIETANDDLKKENDERMWQEGLLRQVPVVSSLFNWWSPLPKETGVKGRSFNLSSGVIESTENIYKYHMQIHSSGTSVVPSKPSIQTPIIVTPDHSRTSSKSSLDNTSRGPSPLPLSSPDSGKEHRLQQST